MYIYIYNSLIYTDTVYNPNIYIYIYIEVLHRIQLIECKNIDGGSTCGSTRQMEVLLLDPTMTESQHYIRTRF